MSTVVVPFDFSRQAERALALALRGRPFGQDATVDILHVVDADLYRRVVGRHGVPSDAAVKTYLEEYVAKQRADLGGDRLPAYTLSVAHGHPVSCIVAHVVERAPIGVMLGGQGHGGLGEVLMGRTALRVLRKAHRSTYVVKETAQVVDTRAVLCAVDLSDSSAAALTVARDLCATLGVPLEIVYVVELLEAPYLGGVGYAAGLQSASSDALVGFELRTLGQQTAAARHVVIGTPARAITRVATERKAGLLVLGSQRGATEHMLLGSVSERVALLSPIDVLVVRPLDLPK